MAKAAPSEDPEFDSLHQLIFHHGLAVISLHHLKEFLEAMNIRMLTHDPVVSRFRDLLTESLVREGMADHLLLENLGDLTMYFLKVNFVSI